jgi:competence protein ComEC
MLSVDTFTSIINQLLPEPHAGLLSGMLFGGSSMLPTELIDALIITGTLHIVALSGTNITILTAMTRSVLSWFVPVNVSTILMIPLVIGFVFFVGPSPSINRAAIMGIVSIGSQLTGKKIAGLVSWGIAVTLMILIEPSIITNLSFQLSGGASLGIVLFDRMTPYRWVPPAKTWRKAFRQLSESAWGSAVVGLRTTLSAQVFTIPIILFAFQRVSLISPVTNLLIAWTIPWIMGLGIAISLVGMVFLPLARPLSWIAWTLLTYLITAIDITSRVPFSSIGR